ncbi:tRNA(fMet)-specific endonuclease VapC [Rhizobiales bacterium GAS191]|jgi:tRNA(fMet)-specific endonuclease VapC|nr:tRNA(fMet)-specific endonuclease VapC [Rhizobiales bacterium GAS113]SED92412.1 tRNA(fMet)-specific endonuclease VapC [Rhizobiales bacterium GAS188]SEE58586.1 tRNA(fMet)-specific endonuclease VapC [Rhizobiales bacterium GAS191]
MICLDTNVVIGAINGRNPIIRTRLSEHIGSRVPLVVPVIALYEMRYGNAKSDRREASEQLLDEFLASGIGIVPFEQEDARHAGDIRAHLESRGTPIGHYDYLIAAQARSRRATLVTANRREFERVPGLIVTDWAA